MRSLLLLTAFSLLTAQAGAQTPPSPRDSLRPFYHGSRSERLVALTFDACATSMRSRYDHAVIETLQQTRTPATLFLGGYWILRHPDAVRTLAGDTLFELGNHSLGHKHMTQLPEDSLLSELFETEQALLRVAGRKSRWIRPPFGEWDQRLVRIADSLGMGTAMYDLASGDPDSSFTAERLTRYVVTSARNGSVLVMHMNGNGRHTAEALPTIISGLRARGFRFVTLSQLAEASRRRSLLHGGR